MKMILVTASFATLLASTVFASAASDPNSSGVTGGGNSGYNWAILHDVKFDASNPTATGGGSSGYNSAVLHDA
jgi:opacity protein-like surface antigen